MLSDVGEKLWAVINSLSVPGGDLESVLKSADISEDILEALLKESGLSENKIKAFSSQALSLINGLGKSSTLEQQLQQVLSTLGVSDAAVQAAIVSGVQQLLPHLNLTGIDVMANLKHLEALLSGSGLPNAALLGQVQKMLKSANISTAEVLAVLQHVQEFVSGFNVFVGSVEAAVKDLLDLDIPGAGALDAFDEIFDLLNELGISKADVKQGAEAAKGFLSTLTLADMPALLADMHDLLVVAGVPRGNLQATISSFVDEAKAIKSLLLSS